MSANFTLREMLEQADLSQRDLAAGAGLSAMSVSRYARGLAAPSRATAEELAAAFNEVVGEDAVDTDDVLLACCRSMLRDRDSGVVETRPLSEGSASDVVGAVQYIWGIANCVVVSEGFRSEVEAIGEKLLAAVEAEVRRVVD